MFRLEAKVFEMCMENRSSAMVTHSEGLERNLKRSSGRMKAINKI